MSLVLSSQAPSRPSSPRLNTESHPLSPPAPFKSPREENLYNSVEPYVVDKPVVLSPLPAPQAPYRSSSLYADESHQLSALVQFAQLSLQRETEVSRSDESSVVGNGLSSSKLRKDQGPKCFTASSSVSFIRVGVDDVANNGIAGTTTEV